jgi:hypothetical protein
MWRSFAATAIVSQWTASVDGVHLHRLRCFLGASHMTSGPVAQPESTGIILQKQVN